MGIIGECILGIADAYEACANFLNPKRKIAKERERLLDPLNLFIAAMNAHMQVSSLRLLKNANNELERLLSPQERKQEQGKEIEIWIRKMKDEGIMIEEMCIKIKKMQEEVDEIIRRLTKLSDSDSDKTRFSRL